jgi:tRNA(Leu) C34 or U34 (ribose-2'-O)-methylase TrmL
MSQGYFGIGVYHPKTESNIGTLWRSAYNFGANHIFTIGRRYKNQTSDTVKAWKQIPLFEYADWENFISNIPYYASLVAIEQAEGAGNLKVANHPKQAIYVLGAEDGGIPIKLMHDHQKVFIDTPLCLNVAVAGSIVMYDRQCKI